MQYMNMNNAIREKGQLSVNGVGIVKVKSDLAILKVGVTTSNEDVQVAQVENTNTVNAVITSLTDYKIPRENINADDVVIKRIRDNATNQVIGYEITTNITIEVEDIKNLGDIYSLAIENGANSEVNISFTLSNVNHHYKKALLKATQDALNKGNLLSKSLNIRLKPLPESISENSTSIYSVSQKNIAYSSSPFLSSGDLEVKAQVGIVFNTYL
ncbi:periplasmic immunogenic protein [[Clostridium] sordellii]|uniref:Periplasmic immunogenic protein n=1 Tax=Paraclostridium sordellii TaxID=1505 RepID=A0A9P1L0B5_PARSO|nr:SIMPL domain-containing protein [Paeniclostridium sordellii]MBS6024939.1 SIMPL domain-containing protein [Paeniclostridium sordellii]MCQ4697819.1 SIMPL domain-containing protein [Paeniclostridium sordellii]MCR1849344.1 SIMPL domain-containing protein [Paeniclostridium sordellii]MDU1454163.1 SIMPL domain-containing protein [Paeniclostridium sordellii]MDU2686040.1 SIMPL domain-containing protein [Paeniclostridium sordellii]